MFLLRAYSWFMFLLIFTCTPSTVEHATIFFFLAASRAALYFNHGQRFRFGVLCFTHGSGTAKRPWSCAQMTRTCCKYSRGCERHGGRGTGRSETTSFQQSGRRPRDGTEAEHHCGVSRMRERKLNLNSEGQYAASKNTMRHCAQALHGSDIARGTARLSVKENKHMLKQSRVWSFACRSI